ncbi:MAG: HAD family hydrolase [Spirochaetaceae bacterium]|jgi:putative hydrolase of the HAD superfamily|nr:HAD family hydrolase [Spirochaetaceae bacterium]
MHKDIAAVAFDVDGTLYPDYRFFLRALPQALFHPRLFAAFAAARKKIRLTGAAENSFYDLQARLCAETLGMAMNIENVRALISKHIYGAWESIFSRVKIYPHVKECIGSFRERGIKLAVLSDFPLGVKLNSLQLGGLWDLELCSEELGALKPHPLPFRRLAEGLNLPPQRILYVGNSTAYDAAGAYEAGMMTALRRFPLWFKPRFPDLLSGSVFTFNDYRQLQKYVLR